MCKHLLRNQRLVSLLETLKTKKIFNKKIKSKISCLFFYLKRSWLDCKHWPMETIVQPQQNCMFPFAWQRHCIPIHVVYVYFCQLLIKISSTISSVRPALISNRKILNRCYLYFTNYKYNVLAKSAFWLLRLKNKTTYFLFYFLF